MHTRVDSGNRDSLITQWDVFIGLYRYVSIFWSETLKRFNPWTASSSAHTGRWVHFDP